MDVLVLVVRPSEQCQVCKVPLGSPASSQLLAAAISPQDNIDYIFAPDPASEAVSRMFKSTDDSIF